MRIGIFGGTFDPPHLGHLVPIEAAYARFQLDQVWYVPAFIPPHKSNEELTSPYHRAAMLALSLQPYDRFLLSTYELDAGRIVYTVETIEEFRKTPGPSHQLFLILGTDSFLELQTWRDYRRLIQLCELIIIDRGAKEAESRRHLQHLESILQSDLSKTIHFAGTPEVPISSTDIRQAIRDGRDINSMVSPEVAEYIRKHSIYQRRS
jgi:nicotinate-nucleotide adenylyltransferase